MDALRVGAVPYLNVQPLLYGLAEQVSLTFAPPSQLVELLLRGQVQVATVPAFYLCEHEGALIQGAAITTLGRAESVLLFHRGDLSGVRRLALNSESRTSNALAQIVLRETYGCSPQAIVRQPDLEAMLTECDAAVLIGDYALSRAETPFPRLDLGVAWSGLAGLPMVWAPWVAVDEAAARAAQPMLLQAKEAGLAHLPEIAADYARRSGLPEATCLRYLTETMSYEFAEAEREGLAEFQRRCRQHGLC
jgi:chorismate dehydratase